jgi:hypothetical protein
MAARGARSQPRHKVPRHDVVRLAAEAVRDVQAVDRAIVGKSNALTRASVEKAAKALGIELPPLPEQ